MDPERQPLLAPSTSYYQNPHRPLTYDEVKASRHERPWRRFRLLLVLVFWGTIAMFLSIIVCMLISAAPCPAPLAPSVPPAHITLAPLISRARIMNEMYTL